MLQSRSYPSVYPQVPLRQWPAYRDLRIPLPPSILVDPHLREDEEKRSRASNSTLNSMGFTTVTSLADKRLRARHGDMAQVTNCLGIISPRILESPRLFKEADVACVLSNSML